MVRYNVKLKDKNIVLAKNVKMANSMISRIMGLMFKKEFDQYDGLLIYPCNSIHTFFMRMIIDVVFLDRHDRIIHIIRKMRPWRMSWIYFKASKVLELPEGMVDIEVSKGDYLEMVCIN